MDALVTPGSLRDRSTAATAWRHAAHFGPLLLLALAAFLIAAHRARAGTPFALRAVYGAVVALNMLSLAMSSWSTILGAAVVLAQRLGFAAQGPILRPPTGRARTAILLPIYEEDAARVFAAARAMTDDLTSMGEIDLFVLSDSRSSEAIDSETAVYALVARPAQEGPRIFYRHRSCNSGRKAGNIADFVTRWGASYDFMVVLDADSLMTGEAIARLIGAMEANPRAGLIQLMCYPVGRRSLFARLQQFNARLYGPLFQRGVAFWQGPRGNFWGHNAIVRIAAFADCCGLPVLPGRAPLGGEIMSHDTVEAALMLRGGHDVWLLPDDRDRPSVGSWEETPTNLVDHLARDRRWCRGNLQHVAVLRADGLGPASLYHLVRGLLHYLSAPLMLSWIVLYAAIDRGIRADALVAIIAAMIVVPRLLSVGLVLADRRQADRFGGRFTVVVGALLDQLVGALTYPLTLVFHIVFLAGMLFGAETRWDAQVRDDRGLTWRDAGHRLLWPVGAGLIGLALLALLAPLPAILLAPGLLLAVPLTVAGGTRMAAAASLLRTPEDGWSLPLRDRVAGLEAILRAGRNLDPSAIAPVLPPEVELAMPRQTLRAGASRGNV